MYSKLNFRLNKFINNYTAWIGVNCILMNFNYQKRRDKFIITPKSYLKTRRCISLVAVTPLFYVLRTIDRYLVDDNFSFSICYIFSVLTTLLSISIIILFYNIYPIVSLCSQTQNYAYDFKGKTTNIVKD